MLWKRAEPLRQLVAAISLTRTKQDAHALQAVRSERVPDERFERGAPSSSWLVTGSGNDS